LHERPGVIAATQVDSFLHAAQTKKEETPASFIAR
jgi:hypothetical protein